MSDFNQDMENLLNAYDSNWQDYLILREQFIEKYSLSVEKIQEIRVEELKDFNSKLLQAELKNQKLQEQLNTAKKYIEHVIGTIKHDGHLGTIQTECILPYLEKALVAIGNEGNGDE